MTAESDTLPRNERLRLLLGEPVACYLCGLPLTYEEATADHILPVSRGGTSAIENRPWSHDTCNQVKGRLTLSELRALVRRIAAHLGE
jgi:5-methylcytosine-specific restriction endonuclease McrA